MKRLNILSLLLTIFLVLPDIAPAQVDSYMELGKRAYQEHRYSRAIGYFDRVVKENPDYPEVYVYRGLSYFATEDYLGAEVDFQRALELGFYDPPSGQTADGKPYPRLTEQDAAKIHNNRGLALYRLDEYDDAMDQFREAFKLDGSLRLAKENYDQARRMRRNAGEGAANASRGGGRYEGVFLDSRPQIPAIANANQGPPMEREDIEHLRGIRLVEQGLRDPERGLRPKEFKRRYNLGVPNTFRDVTYAAASQSYISVERVVISRNATYVTFYVKNPSLRGANICIADRLRDGAFYLVDASGTYRSKIDMIEVVEEKMSTCPELTDLAAGQGLDFTLKFERVPDEVGYINIIEGDRNDGNQWNFYRVDLTE